MGRRSDLKAGKCVFATQLLLRSWLAVCARLKLAATCDEFALLGSMQMVADGVFRAKPATKTQAGSQRGRVRIQSLK